MNTNKTIKQLAEFVAPVEFMLTDDGLIYVYVSDVLADSEPASKAALEWACAAVNDEGVQEQNLALTLDIPASVASSLDFYNEGTGDELILSLVAKPQFDVLRAKLEEALKVFDRVQWIE